MHDGRLTLRTHWFYCAPYSFHHAPADSTQTWRPAALVLLKGDLNYRRLVGDCGWAPTAPFQEAAGYFPTTVAALRTLKSELVVGIGASTVQVLDEHDPAWRTNGSRGTVQLLTRAV